MRFHLTVFPAFLFLTTALAAGQLKPSVAPQSVQSSASLPSVDDQTPVLAKFPMLSGAARKWFSSDRQVDTWQERALYAFAGSPQSAADTYTQQLVAAGWASLSRVESGSATTQNQITVDFNKNQTKAHLVIAQDPKQGATLAVALTTLFVRGAPPLSPVTAPVPASVASVAATDRGARDPADFPRLPGSTRLSFDSSVNPSGTREAATYATSSMPDSAEVFFAQNLRGGGWIENYRYEYVDDVTGNHQLQLTWKTATRTAAIAVNAASGSSTSIRVTIVPGSSAAAGMPPPSQVHALLPSNTHGSDSGSGGGSPGSTSSGSGGSSAGQSGAQSNSAGSQAGPIWMECSRPNVTVHTGTYARLELQCGTPYQGTISYFTYPSTGANSADADRLLSLAQGHDLNRYATQHLIDLGSKGTILVYEEINVSQLWIMFDPNDLSGTSSGCLNQDCRKIMSLRLVPLLLNGVH